MNCNLDPEAYRLKNLCGHLTIGLQEGMYYLNEQMLASRKSCTLAYLTCDAVLPRAREGVFTHILLCWNSYRVSTPVSNAVFIMVVESCSCI